MDEQRELKRLGPSGSASLGMKPEMAQEIAGLAYRTTSKQALSEMILRKDRELVELKALYDSLPDKMIPMADEALWRLIIGIKN